MRSLLFALVLLCVVNVQGQDSNESSQRGREIAQKLREAFDGTCRPDVESQCGSVDANDLRAVFRCISQHLPSVSMACKIKLLQAINAANSQRVPTSGGQGGSGLSPTQQAKQTQLKQCIPGITRTCNAQVMELMTNPLDTDGEDLVECAKAHSSTIGGPCEQLVEKLTRDGLATDIIECGQNFLGLCPTEAMALVASRTQSQVDWPVVNRFLRCLGRKKDEIPEMCELIANAIESSEPDGEYEEDEEEAKGYGAGYGELSKAHGDGHQHHHDGHKGSTVVPVLVTLLGFCVCAGFAAAAYWKRAELQGMMGGRAASHSTGGDFQFQQLDVEQRAGLTGATIATSAPPSSTMAPPEYAIVQSTPASTDAKNIVIATPNNTLG